MEFHEKLKELRTRRGLTQEELAQMLFVSRTAISKLESGRGYPSIDSLKAIAAYFSVSLDDLLSGEAILTIAENERNRHKDFCRSLIFGAADCCAALLLFLPFFAERGGSSVHAVPLLSLSVSPLYIKAVFLAFVITALICGAAAIALRNEEAAFRQKSICKVSIGLSIAEVIVFTAALQPYAAVFAFALLIIKVLLLIKLP